MMDGVKVAGQIIEDDDVAFGQCRGKLSLDILFKDLPVHWAIDDPRHLQPVMAQASDEGLSVPVPERCISVKPLSLWCPSRRLDHVCFQRSLIDKDKPFQSMSHNGLAVKLHIRTLLLTCYKRLFLCDKPRRCSSRPIKERWTLRLCGTFSS